MGLLTARASDREVFDLVANDLDSDLANVHFNLPPQ